MRTTAQSDVGKLRKLIVKHVRDAFVDDATIDGQWQRLNYYGRPDLRRAVAEYDQFVKLLEGLGAEIEFLPQDGSVTMDSLYPRDAAITTDRGIILCSMGKEDRRTEPSAMTGVMRRLGSPILGSITGAGRVEGGDVTWLDRDTLAVGQGYRTNDDGIRQLRRLFGNDVQVVVVPLPHWRGPADVFHLMSMISPVADDLAVVYSPLLPVPFRQFLLARGFGLVEVPDEEFESMGCNVLAVAPRVCLLRTGNPKTRQRLEAAGAEVHEFAGDEICGRGAGGPTCLTRPLSRELA
ncbi:MAG TPA: arginine deiminase family protein [Methylomirabilota bacterium]|nr:arginine deiminase family protein [Methylomirabilota bacterium]